MRRSVLLIPDGPRVSEPVLVRVEETQPPSQSFLSSSAAAQRRSARFRIGASSHARSNCLGERMKAPAKIQITVWLLGLAGAALFTVLLLHQGLPQVGAAFAAAGWAIAAVVIYHFVVPVFLDAVAWWVLFPRSDCVPLR